MMEYKQSHPSNNLFARLALIVALVAVALGATSGGVASAGSAPHFDAHACLESGWTQCTPRQLAKLLAGHGAQGDSFGTSVSIDGDTALIGADGDEDHKGAAYVLVRNAAGAWTQQAKLTARDDGVAWDQFGQSVSLDGDTALIGAPGKNYLTTESSGIAYVFVRNGSTWVEQAKLMSYAQPVLGHFGCSVSLDGDTALVGASGHPDHGEQSGAAFVFVRTADVWTRQAKLLAGDGTNYDYFGSSVSVDGDTALIGAVGDMDQAGSAYIFVRNGSTWAQQAKLSAIDGEPDDIFGTVSLSGDTALIGSAWNDARGKDSGSAYIFVRTGPPDNPQWQQQAKLLAGDGAEEDHFGLSVSLSGNTALVGAPYDDDREEDAGSAYIFVRDAAGTWRQRTELRADDGERNNFLGSSVSLSGSTALIGTPWDRDLGYVAGAAYVFDCPAQPGGTITLHAHTGSAPGIGQPGWTVRVYDAINDEDAGSSIEVASGETNDQGDVTLTLNGGPYEYTVENRHSTGTATAASTRHRFVVTTASQTINHRLSVLTAQVVENDTHQSALGYTVLVYDTPEVSGSLLAQQNLGAVSEAAFVVPDGEYSLLATKSCFVSPTPTYATLAYGEDRSYVVRGAGMLPVRISVEDNAGRPKHGYEARIYDVTGMVVNHGVTNYRGWTDLAVKPFGEYAYLVFKSGVQSKLYIVGEGGPLCKPVENTYRVARVTVHVGDPDGGNHAERRVRLFRGDGQFLRTEWTDASGNVNLDLIDDMYLYDVFRRGVTSPRYGIQVTPPSSEADDQTVEYTLAKVTVHVRNLWGRPLKGRRAALYSFPLTRLYGSDLTDAKGNVVIYPIEGPYRYRVWQTGYKSEFLPADGFTVSQGDVQSFDHVVP